MKKPGIFDSFKAMRKFDILVILIVLAISITFYLSYFNVFNIGENQIVEVTYQNQLIYTVKLTEQTNITLVITSNNKVLTVDDGTRVRTYPILTDVEIANTVSITYKEIHMISANCPNQYCLQMNLSLKRPLPIVCTNGVMVKLKTQEIIIEV